MELIRCIVACLALAEATAVRPPDEVPVRTVALTVDTPVRAVARPIRSASIAVGLEAPIAELLVSEGGRVRAGQPIARLDDRVARASLRSAEARAAMNGPVRAAEANLRHAELRLDRVRRAHEERAASASELEDARLLVEKARAELNSAREALAIDGLVRDELAARLERHTVRAPFAGVVDRVLADAGESPGATAPLVELVSTERLRVELHLPAFWHGRVEPGDAIELAAGTPIDGPVRAVVAAVSPILDAPTRTVRCVAHIENADGRLPAGLTVTLGEPASSSGSVASVEVSD